MSTVRTALYEVLGEKCAHSIIDDLSFEWCIATAVAMIETKGGPQTQIQRGFLKWVREDYPNIEVVPESASDQRVPDVPRMEAEPKA